MSALRYFQPGRFLPYTLSQLSWLIATTKILSKATHNISLDLKLSEIYTHEQEVQLVIHIFILLFNEIVIAFKPPFFKFLLLKIATLNFLLSI